MAVFGGDAEQLTAEHFPAKVSAQVAGVVRLEGRVLWNELADEYIASQATPVAFGSARRFCLGVQCGRVSPG